jgi:ferredoxin-nitrite reductase
MNKFETMKQIKDGLAVIDDIPTFARDGFTTIPDDDLERLKWAGIFHRKPTRPYFMMRIRFPGGVAAAAQLRVVADLIARYGRSIGDLTTRQQIEPRWLRIEDMPAIRERLDAVGLTSLQTGMDNIRGVVSCPLSGLYSREIVDAAPLCAEFQSMFVGDRAFTNLPRKFNVAITGCPDNCVDAESQDVALVPAVKAIAGAEAAGFNVLVGGKMGSGGFRAAEPLDVFVRSKDAARICRELVLIFRNFGPRETRSRARFAFLIEERGLAWIRAMAEERMGHELMSAGTDGRSAQQVDHVGVTPQAQIGLNAIGLVVPVGRFTAPQLYELARLADAYGRGEVRLTTEQNVVIPHVPDDLVPALLAEPLVEEWTPAASPALRGLISCTGTEFCNLALIETKARALEVARALESRLSDRPLKIRWSGCPAACGNHHVADIGLQGKRIRLPDGRVVEAVTISAGGKTGPGARAATVVHEDVVCDERLPELLAELAVGEAVCA